MDNVRGSVFMVIAMAGFALEDMFVKAVSRTLPVGEILILFGLGGTLVLTICSSYRGCCFLRTAGQPHLDRNCVYHS